MKTLAVVFEAPQKVGLRPVELAAVGPHDVVVETTFSGISTGTERLLYSGRMPPFPGLGYPLVPGYETVGRVVERGAEARFQVGDFVFVPGTRGFVDIRGLFGGAASRVVAEGSRLAVVPEALGEQACLLALAATAWHAMRAETAPTPDLIVGHGVLGRLLARLAVSRGGTPIVWETNADRRSGEAGYSVVAPSDDDRRDYQRIIDVSGDAAILDTLIGRLARGGHIVLAGFYSDRPSFDFAPAFMREVTIEIAAEWVREDLDAVSHLVAAGALSLDGLITHRNRVRREEGGAETAYRTAFEDPNCLKMILDWRTDR